MPYKEEPKVRPPDTPEGWHWHSIMGRYCPGPSEEELESSPRMRCITPFFWENERRISEGLPELTLDQWWGESPDES